MSITDIVLEIQEEVGLSVFYELLLIANKYKNNNVIDVKQQYDKIYKHLYEGEFANKGRVELTMQAIKQTRTYFQARHNIKGLD